jgi:hypothetical protein
VTTTDQDPAQRSGSSSDPSNDQGGVALRVLRWLEAGYPDGIPRQDRFPLIALLRRRLDDEQVRAIVADLTAPGAVETRGDDPITGEEIETLIARQLRESPTPEDVSRVSARLAAAGWPLADAPE